MNTEFWVYRGKDSAGREICGAVESPDKDTATGLLRRKGVHILEISHRYQEKGAPDEIDSRQQSNGLLALILFASLLAFSLVSDLETYQRVKLMAPPRGAETESAVTDFTAKTRRVEYTFHVDGKEYKGSERILRRSDTLPETGQSVTVHYARENPAINCLHPEQPATLKISSFVFLFLLGVSLIGFVILASRDNLYTLYFLLRHRQPLFRKELVSVSGIIALFLFFPFATASARFVWMCFQNEGTAQNLACSTVLLFLSLTITGMLAGIVVITLWVERAYRTRLVPESYIDWREGRAKAAARQAAGTVRSQSPRKKAAGTLVFGLFWSVFSAVGFMTFGLPVLLHFPLWLSDSWKPVPCTILSSEQVHGVGFRYGPTTTINYRYSFEGQTYVSNEYKLGLTRAALPAETYRIGQTTTCYVNPDWPGHPVLKLAETWDALQWVVIALFFTIWQGIGLALVAAGCKLLVRSLRRETG